MARRVLFWGRFDPGYSRNRVYAALFRELGWDVDYFFVKVWPRFGDVEAFLRGLWLRPKPDLVWVPVARQRDIAAACRWAHRRGIKVVFDPMISAWDKKVLEQRKWKAEEPRAKKLLARETKLMNMPDLVCWDTSCHVDFCAEYLKVPREKLRVLLTGTDETVFKPVEGEKVSHLPTSSPSHLPFRVLYHGAYLPLHGTETIVEAARMTQGTGIHWDFLGWGAYKASTEAKAKGITNITFLEKVPYVDVPKVITAHDIVLGVFGTTAKAARVIGNKVYECMACARPTINEFCTGYPPEAKDCKAIKFIPAGDTAALVKAVEEYRADWANRDSYFAAARDFFEKHLSMAVIKKQLAGILADLGLPAGMNTNTLTADPSSPPPRQNDGPVRHRNLFVFVLWQKARRFESDILAMLRKEFTILHDEELSWPSRQFTRRLQEFYGFGSKFLWWNKSRKTGRGPFLAVLVEDAKPVWQNRKDTRGRAMLVDDHVYRIKEAARRLTGHSNNVHSSLTLEETNTEVNDLWGCTPEELASGKRMDTSDGKIQK